MLICIKRPGREPVRLRCEGRFFFYCNIFFDIVQIQPLTLIVSV